MYEMLCIQHPLSAMRAVETFRTLIRRAIGPSLRRTSYPVAIPLDNAKDWFWNPSDTSTKRIMSIEEQHISRYLSRDLAALQERVQNRCHLFTTNTSLDAAGPSTVDVFGEYEYHMERPANAANMRIWRKALDPKSSSSTQQSQSRRELVVDMNVLGERLPQPASVCFVRPDLSQRYVGLIVEVGPDGRKLLFVKDMKLSAICQLTFDGKDSINGGVIKFEWGCSYSTHDIEIYIMFTRDHIRPSVIYRYQLDQQKLFSRNRFRAVNINKQQMQLLLEERNPAMFLDIYRTRDNMYMVINSNSKISSECYLLLKDPHNEGHQEPYTFSKRMNGIQYYLSHSKGAFYVISNINTSEKDETHIGHKLRLFRCEDIDMKNLDKIELSDPKRWELIWPCQDNSTSEMAVEDADFFDEFVVCYGRKSNVATMSKISLHSGQETCYIDDILREIGTTGHRLEASANDNRGNTFRINISSPFIPEISGETGDDEQYTSIKWFNKTDIVGSPAFDSSKYISEHYQVSSKSLSQGVMVSATSDLASFPDCLIPLTVISSCCRKGPTPLLLMAYGSYGVSYPMSYRPELITLLESGWSLAFAAVRGGGELGREWHEAGRRMMKWNTFVDFAACSQYLIDKGYTSNGLLCAEFESAGGLIGGVMVNKYPHLFAGILMRNPFLDVYHAIQDPEHALTVHEYDEWGHPENLDELNYIRSYCPVTNIGASADAQKEHLLRGDLCQQLPHSFSVGPAVFVSVSLQDNNVGPWESLKFVSAIREHRMRNTSSPGSLRPDGHRAYNEDSVSVRKKLDHNNSIPTYQPPMIDSFQDIGQVFLRILSDSGHGGPRCISERHLERAVELSFLDYAITRRAPPSAISGSS